MISPLHFEKIHHAMHNHILLGEVIVSVKRIVLAYRIWRIDRQYSALNRELDALQYTVEEAQANAEFARRHLLMLRADLRVDMIQLGGR
jgi:hypothetical protein